MKTTEKPQRSSKHYFWRDETELNDTNKLEISRIIIDMANRVFSEVENKQYKKINIVLSLIKFNE